MKRFLAIITVCIMLLILASCENRQPHKGNADNKLSVIAAMFAEYDFAKQIVGEHGNVEMLMPAGSEIHSYEPTPQDIINIKNADIFIYGGGESDTWLDTVLDSVEPESLRIISMTDLCELYEEESVEGMESDHVHDESCDHDHGHSEYDEHVWTSPVNAIKIIEEITKAVCEKDKKHQSEYIENSKKYIDKISALHLQFKETVENADKKLMIFADRFPFRYFVEEYGLSYYAAFPGCSHDTEPGAKTIQFLIDKVKCERIPVIFTIENSNRNVAMAIGDETKAKILEFHSCHNVTKTQLENGITYVELMTQNLENLKEALN